MRTNDNNILESIIGILTNIDLNKAKDIVDKSDKTALLDYINKEFLDLKEYKAIIEDMKLNKNDILEILYQIVSLVYTSTDKYDNISITEQLITEANNKGFTWPNSKSCFKKIEEEFLELKKAVKQNNENQLVKNYISPEEYKNGYGRELFRNNRAQVTNSENGAISIG